VRSDEDASIGYDFAQGSPESRTPSAGASLSGHERDHLFLNLEGERFIDISGVSGLDHPGDGRAFGVLDYDRDGWPDLAVASANAPLLQLYRNRIGELRDEQAADANIIALRFVGGNETASPSQELSNRDGYGAIVRVTLPARTLLREHRAGEGLAAQNSATMMVGIGSHQMASEINIRWPSGRTQALPEIAAGSLVTLYENPDRSESGQGYDVVDYHQAPARERPQQAPLTTDAGSATWPPWHESGHESSAKLVLYTTFATWCQACVTEIPQLSVLRSTFDIDTLEMIGVPYDEKESTAKREKWLDTYEPPYRALRALDTENVLETQQFIRREFKLDGIPATIITSGDGEIVMTRWGPPSVSEIRRLLATRGREAGP